MADFGDPYAAMATNPYMQAPQKPDWMSFLGNALTGIGAGIGQADASGQGWASGIGPGLMYANQAQAQRQHQAEQEQMRRMVFGMQMAEFGDKRAERDRKLQMQQAAANEFAPGLRAPTPSAVNMGPGSYDTKVAGLEGGTRNGGMVFNELGSGAYGPYQFMPSTWADVVAKNPNLGLPTDITKATREQHDTAHNAFKSGNAQALQAAGFQPTPDNLYLAHRFGVGGATSVLRADPNQSLAEVLPVDWQKQNPDMRGQTAGGFRRLAAERVGGVGVPYEVQPNAKPTQYALGVDSLPSFDIPGGVSSLVPRTNQTPSWTAPVMPQPQGVVPAQFTPPGPAPAATPAPEGPPSLADVPKPELPAAEAVRIRRALMNQTMTPEQARTESRQIVNDLWNAQKEQVRARYQQDSENYRHKRGIDVDEQKFKRNLDVEGDWVRTTPGGPETFVPKSQRTPGQTRYDKPPEAPQPGTEPGDYRVLTDGANSGKTDSREYAAAWNRVKNKFIDIGNNQKLPPDMRAFPEPTFKEAMDRPAPTPIGERERKFTEAESKNHVYSTQLNEAIPRLEALIKDPETGKYSTKNLPGNYAQVKAHSSYVPEFMVDEKAKQFREIEMAILTGTLRPASGATILPSEFVSERAKYIPQPGDTSEQIKAKLTALKAVARAVAEGTGRERSLYPNLFKQGGGDGGQDETKTSPIRIDMSGKRQ